MQTFRTGKLVGIAPYSYNVASMLPKMISVRMPHNDFVKSLLAVIRTEEQSFVRTMSSNMIRSCVET